MDIPTTEPEEFFSGDTVKWNRQDLSSDYPAPTWTLTYYFRGPPGEFNVIASADSSFFSVSISPATSTEYKPGDYTWTAKVSDGTDTYTVDSGACIVKTDLAGKGPGFDHRSHVKMVLDALEAAILKKANKDQLKLNIDGFAIERMTPEQMRDWRREYKDEYSRELKAEQKKKGKGTGDRILVKFI